MAFCLLLVQLSWSERLFTLTREFHRSQAWLSFVFNNVLLHLQTEFGDIVRWHPSLNNYKQLEIYAKAISKNLDIQKLWIWGFVDGTFRDVCWLTENQQKVYFGYKKHHGIKFQRIVLPDSIISSLDGLYKDRLND